MGQGESKLAFRKNVFQLYEQKSVPATSDDYWSGFYKLPESAEDVFNLFAPKDIRRVRDTAPENLETLLQKILERVFAFANSTTNPTKDDIRDVLNCIRILTRILPYIFEVEGAQQEEQLFWSSEHGEPIGAKLVLTVVQLLFFRGFTLPESADAGAVGAQYIIWQQGVGASTSPPATREHINNRTETLRLLLTMLSRVMYCAPADVLRFENRWAVTLATGLQKKAVLSLLCSLINTPVHYDPVGWGLLPYNHLIFADAQEQLVTLCLQTLTALLDINVVTAEGDAVLERGDSAEDSLSFSPAGQGEKKKEAHGNEFRYYLGKLHRAQDFMLIMDAFCRILKNPLESANTYLPGSTKRVNIHAEVLLLFWKLLEHNEKFAAQAVETDKILTILAAMIYFALEARKDAAQIGLARVCCFIIHILSTHRSFGVQLNTAFDSASVGAVGKAIPIFSAGCWGDFLFLALYTLITTSGRNPLAPLQESFLIILANVSPYVKSLTVTTSNKLLSLFGSFSSPAFLMANESNHKLVFYLLEVFNNIIQYQITGNTQLVYSIIRHKDKFHELHNLTYEHAEEELQRMRTLKAQKQSGNGSNGSLVSLESALAGSPSAASPTEGAAESGPTSPRDESVELSEKAKGKLPASGAELPRESIGSAGRPSESKGRFQPNQEWFNYWRAHLPLSVILTLTDSLGQPIEQLCIDKGLNDDRQILDYLKSGTLVGLLPVPHPIFVRRFQYGDAVRVWFASYLWGCVFTKSTGTGAAEIARLCPPIWTGTHVKLFQVKLSA